MERVCEVGKHNLEKLPVYPAKNLSFRRTVKGANRFPRVLGLFF